MAEEVRTGDIWNGRQFVSTFPSDFAIANKYGIPAVKDTFNRAFEAWKEDYRYLTDLVITLNWYIWRFYKENEPLARVYNTLWEKAKNYAESHLKGEEMDYYFKETD